MSDRMTDIEIYQNFKKCNQEVVSFIIGRINNEIKTSIDHSDSAMESCLQWVFKDGCKAWMDDLHEQDAISDEDYEIVTQKHICWEDVEKDLRAVYQEDWERVQAEDEWLNRPKCPCGLTLSDDDFRFENGKCEGCQ